MASDNERDVVGRLRPPGRTAIRKWRLRLRTAQVIIAAGAFVYLTYFQITHHVPLMWPDYLLFGCVALLLIIGVVGSAMARRSRAVTQSLTVRATATIRQVRDMFDGAHAGRTDRLALIAIEIDLFAAGGGLVGAALWYAGLIPADQATPIRPGAQMPCMINPAALGEFQLYPGDHVDDSTLTHRPVDFREYKTPR